MQLFVKNVSGDSKFAPNLTSPIMTNTAVAMALTIPSSCTVQNLTTLLSLRTSLPEEDLRLVFAGKHLAPSSTLADNHILRESTIHLALPLRGGMPPKKIRCTYKDCKEGAQRIIGDCGFCNGHYCGKHRLLEDHKCDGLEDVCSPHSSTTWLLGLQDVLTDMCENSARSNLMTVTQRN
jgi:hypothetical protein